MSQFTPHHIRFAATVIDSLDRTQWPESVEFSAGQLRFEWNGDDVLEVMGEHD